jgi:hypothetical protein
MEIKGYIQTSNSDNQDSQLSTQPSLSVIEDEVFKLSLSAAFMKDAEIVQPWGTIGVDRWIQAGKWWL